MRCPFCHIEVSPLDYSDHQLQHTERRSDGQQRDHFTLPPEERYTQSLAREPSAYHHALCGVVTTMPEEIIRSYLVNPFLYTHRTFCVGCEDYVPTRDVRWIETNESLASYFERLCARAGPWHPGRLRVFGGYVFKACLFAVVFGAVGSLALRHGFFLGSLAGSLAGLGHHYWSRH